jgi:putative ABC transport system substrate-binding protein
VRRRDFITLLGTAAAWPIVAAAQQPEQKRRLGVLTGAADAPVLRPRFAALGQALESLGWADGRNLQIEYRWGSGSTASIRKNAEELVALSPDAILASGGATVEQLLQVTRTVPIIFVIVPDPVGSGFVESLSQPGGNATGFMQFEYALSAKWVELLKEIVPSVKRAAVLWDPTIAAGIGQFAVIQSVAPSVGLDVRPINLRDIAGLERSIAAFASSSGGALIVPASAMAVSHRDLIVQLADRYKLPAIYNSRDYVDRGGLASYGADFLDQYRRAAHYVDRVLKGEKPARLPVQAPVKYQLVINLKTAKALGLDVPATLLARADEVIE